MYCYSCSDAIANAIAFSLAHGCTNQSAEHIPLASSVSNAVS